MTKIALTLFFISCSINYSILAMNEKGDNASLIDGIPWHNRTLEVKFLGESRKQPEVVKAVEEITLSFKGKMRSKKAEGDKVFYCWEIEFETPAIKEQAKVKYDEMHDILPHDYGYQSQWWD